MAGNFRGWSTTILIFFLGIGFAAAAGQAPDSRWEPYPDNRDSKSHCIEAEGKWSYGSHLFDRVALKQDEVVQYDAKISCRGRYDVFVGVSPKETVSIVADSNGWNAYVETEYLEDGTTRERYLKSHRINYSITISSVTDIERAIKVEKSWTVPTYPAGFLSVGIRIPKNFRKNERFRISIAIDADKAFYEDYQWVGASIGIPVH